MNRRAFVTGLGALLAAPGGAGAQPAAKKLAKIGWLAPYPPDPHSPEGQAFWQEMNRAGFVLNDNARLELAVTPADQHLAAAADLVQRHVDVIITVGNIPTLAAKNATAVVPIVMVNVDDPVANGIVSNLGRPGGNVTGLTNMAAPLAGKRLGLLKEALPFVTRIGIMWNATSASNARVVRSVTSMSRTLGIEPHSIEVRKDSYLRDAFRSMVSKRVHAFIVVAENLFWEFRKETVDGALAHRLPGTYPWPEHVRIGGLMSYSHDHVDVWRRAGAYVGRVLAGADVRELPVEEPTKFQLFINLKTAKALGLTIPPSLLLRADQVIE